MFHNVLLLQRVASHKETHNTWFPGSKYQHDYHDRPSQQRQIGLRWHWIDLPAARFGLHRWALAAVADSRYVRLALSLCSRRRRSVRRGGAEGEGGRERESAATWLRWAEGLGFKHINNSIMSHVNCFSCSALPLVGGLGARPAPD